MTFTTHGVVEDVAAFTITLPSTDFFSKRSRGDRFSLPRDNENTFTTVQCLKRKSNNHKS
jgi:hypothetical protein